MERDILTATKTPWLVRLLYAFQDPQHVYLAMEYVPGGDFRTLLNNAGVLKEEIARFYISEMFVGVNELHKLGYIHRDLKPEVREVLPLECLQALLTLYPELPFGQFWPREAHRFWSSNWCTQPAEDRISQGQGEAMCGVRQQRILNPV